MPVGGRASKETERSMNSGKLGWNTERDVKKKNKERTV